MLRRALFVAACGMPVLVPGVAHACGGFFCSTAPIQQAGETIVYGLEDDGTVTMAVQVQYAGLDDDFAWILPVPVPPDEVALGSDALFSALTLATEPVFTRTERTDGDCRDVPRCVHPDGSPSYGGGCSFGEASSPSYYMGPYVDAGPPRDAARAPTPDAARADGGVTVFSEGSLGPYETVVLGAATAPEILAWLGEHGYDVPSRAAPLIDAYASQGHVFIALRLSAERTTSLLRPIVMHLPTSEACLPIRLTAIATTPLLPITALFLGRAPATSRNYSRIEIDVDDPAFWTGERSWDAEVIAGARALGGQAFATEYAGPTPRVALERPPIDDLATATTAFEVMRALRDRGYNAEPDLERILLATMPPPASWSGSARAYYDCLASTSCPQPDVFDPAALVEAIEREIRAPAHVAQQLVDRHGHLTRLVTTMRAEEMTLDPIFIEDPGLPAVSNVHLATLATECDAEHYRHAAPQVLELPSGARHPWADGTIADDHAYCAAMGLVLPSEARPPRSGSCLCAVGQRGQWRGWVLVVALALVLLRRWHGAARD